MFNFQSYIRWFTPEQSYMTTEKQLKKMNQNHQYQPISNQPTHILETLGESNIAMGIPWKLVVFIW